MQRSVVRPVQWFLLLVLLVLRGTDVHAQLVSCSVTPTAPVAVNDDVRWPGGPLVIDVVGNDHDPDGDAFVISAFSQGAHGSVAYTPDFEAVLYTPNGDGAVSDQFSYTISDGQFTATATVYLQNDAPPPPPPPPPAQVWIEGSCNNLNCTFTAYWQNISDTPRYFHWQWPDGTTTPPFYNHRSALKGLSPGTHTVRVTVTFVSGTIISAEKTITVATPQHTCSMFASAFGLQFTARITDVSTDENGDLFDAYDYFYDFDDGVGLRPVDPWSVFQNTGLSYTEPGTRTINFIIRPRGTTTVVGQCPNVLEFTNEPPRPTIEGAVGGDGVTRPKKQFRFTPSAWDEWYHQLGPWEWNFGDGGSAQTSSPTNVDHYYARPGNYTVTLKVTDSLGAVGTIDHVITVPNDPPIVSWRFKCVGRTCTFDASGSTDDGEAMTYSWNYGDGSPVQTSSAPTAAHTFAADQPYDVTLTVDDGTVTVPVAKRVTPRAAPLAEQLVFYALPPCRVVDTREGGRPPLAAGSLNDFVVAGTCGVPIGAKAVAVNAAVISPTNAGWLQMFPSGSAAGEPSLLNFTPARSPRTDNTIVALGADGALIVRPSIVSAGTTHLTLDVTGYFTTDLMGVAPARGPMRYDRYGDYPFRLFDSRTTPPALATGAPRYVKARNGSNAYLPIDAEAHALVITAFNPTAAGHIVLFPSDLTATPLASAMNFQTIPQANGSLMALGRRTNDDLALVYATGGSSTTDFTVDTYGWFSKDGKYRYFPLQPCRAIDTRLTQNGFPRLTHNAARALQLQGNCGVPHGAKFAVVGATIVNPDGAGSAQIGATYDPNIAAIQFAAGDTIANTVIVSLTPLSANNCCANDFQTLVNIPSGGGADLVVDVLGYFMPEVNQGPAAVADTATAVINIPLTIDVLANDSDANGDAIKLSTTRPIFNPPFLGTATRASDTSITYSSTLAGTDTFDYEVVDTRGGISHGRVTLNVRVSNDPPVANPDSASTTNISSVTVDVLANDLDPEGDALTLVSATAPVKGTAVIAVDRILYTPNANVSGTDTFNYTVRDAFGATASATVTISITGANNPPQPQEDSVTVYAGDPVTITPLTNDTDPDGDPLKLSDPAITEQPSLGTAVRTNDTTITYTAGSVAGTDVFQYALNDGRGGNAHGEISVIVQPTCTAPPVISAQPTSRTINLSQPTTFTVTATGGVKPLTYQWYQGTAPSTATPVGTNSNSLTVSPSATTSYWVRVTNACGNTNSVTATVTVCTPPSIATQPASQSIIVGTTATLTVAANGSAPLAYQWYEGPAGTTTTPVGTGSSFTTPVLVADRTYWVRVTSTCNGTATADSVEATITVTCTGAPVITTQPASVSIDGGETATLTVAATAAASYQWYEGESGTTTTAVGTNNSTFKPSPSTTTSYWVEITNSCGVTASSTVTVTVCNPPGIVTEPQSQTITTGETATLTVAAAPLLTDPKIVDASPSIKGWGTTHLFDGDLDTDYASNGAGTDTFIDFDFGTAARFAEVSFTDRRSAGGTNGSGAQGSGDNVTGFNLIFSADAVFGDANDVTVPVTSDSCCDTVVTPIADVVARYVRYDVTSISGGGLNAGAAEFSFRAFDTAPAAPYSYQWYEGSSGTITTPVGTDSATFTTPALSATKTYWARVTSTCNGTAAADSAAATITVTCAAAPAISVQPAPATINAGQSATLTVTASSVGPATYQWYQGPAGTTTTPVGTNSSSLTVSPAASAGYWVRVTNACGSTDSTGAAVTVCIPPTIVTQPASQSVVVNATATLTVVAGGSGPFSYQWYEGTSGTTTTPVGTNSPSFTTPPVTATKSYWVRVTSTCNGSASVNSAAAVVSVTCAVPPSIGTQPTSRTINAGQSTTITVAASSVGTTTYQWYQGTAPSTTTPVGTNSSSLTVTPSATTSYWVRITNGCGSVDSVTVTVTVCVPPGIATQPTSPTIPTWSTATLTVVASGSGPFSYQWYEGTSGVTTTPVGTNSASFTTPALTAPKSYWVRVTSTCNGSASVNSATATVSITCATAPSISAHPTSRTINAGQSTTFSVTASGFGTLTYQWYQGTAPSTTTPVGTNSASLTVTPGATANYWVKVSNACGGTNSTTATVTVCTLPAIATHPASVTINHGATATLTVTATGSAPIAYQWYEGAAGVTTTPVGTNSASFTTPAMTATKSYWVRVTSTCNGSAVVNSNAATVTVIPLQITRRQTSYAAANSQTSITGTWPQATQAGNLLVAVISGLKDPSYLEWTPPAGWVHAVTQEWTNVKTSIYYIPNNAGGRTTEKFNVAAGFHDQILYLMEYSGVMTVNPLDKTALAGDDTNDGYLETGYTANTVQPKELVITGLTSYTQAELYSPSGGYVELHDHYMLWNLTSAVHERMTTAIGSQGHYAQITEPGHQWVGVVATFKSANTN